jgi:hypothetical protein
MKRCAWCGQFTRADAEPMSFRNALGDPATTGGPLCEPCWKSCADLASANIRRAPYLPYFKSMRDEYGWPPELRSGDDRVDAPTP